MKTIINNFRKLIDAWRGLDFEYLINLLVVHLKYRTGEEMRDALIHPKFAFCERRFSHLLRKYQTFDYTNHKNDGPIWICWLQGEESMPPIVRVCYSQLKKTAPENRSVILITWDNLKQYTDIPEYIIEKLNKGYMSYTHFSDIIRFSLLANHGGLWVDSTVYVSSPIPDSVFEQPYFSATTEFDAESSYRYNGINRCLWKCFILGAAAHSTWFCCAKEMIYEYWKTSDFLLDYMMVDFILVTIHDKVPSVRRHLSGCVELAPHLYSLEKLADEPCDESRFHHICETCRWFKLSYKIPFLDKTTNGSLTYFGHIMATYDET